ncbi:speckle-type POZ protein-like [Leptopilina heterotoma]|uniref:speckle-type POZ protein-like n=1 Tax=Leptopilina heterotoma TaxID=63436 RepID=UPI001CAA3B6C|nr:speckle-type POZ protein-like [Leptopilina heterotoma]
MATSEESGRASKEENYSFSLKYIFNWTINDFEFACKNYKVIRSPEFSTKNFKDDKWTITLEPTVLSLHNEDFFKIHLIFDDTKIKMNDKLLNVRISFQRIDNSRIVKSFDTNIAVQSENCLSWKIGGVDFFRNIRESAPINRHGMRDTIVPNSIDVICEINVVFPDKTIFQKPLIDIENCIGLIESNKNFLDNEEFKDVTFNVEDQKFTAHKIILASRSPVFAAMFKNKMTEGLTSVVEIDDIKPAIFQQMLNFIYTDRVENLEESAFELLYVAEKYQLGKLKILSINSLNDKLSSKSVIKTLEVAELYSIDLLKNECLKFINDRRCDIIETKEFQQLLLNRPSLSIDILKVDRARRSECCESYELR